MLAPDGSDYLYFVAKDARNHVFAKTFEEHKRNVDKYVKQTERARSVRAPKPASNVAASGVAVRTRARLIVARRGGTSQGAIEHARA